MGGATDEVGRGRRASHDGRSWSYRGMRLGRWRSPKPWRRANGMNACAGWRAADGGDTARGVGPRCRGTRAWTARRPLWRRRPAARAARRPCWRHRPTKLAVRRPLPRRWWMSAAQCPVMCQRCRMGGTPVSAAARAAALATETVFRVREGERVVVVGTRAIAYGNITYYGLPGGE